MQHGSVSDATQVRFPSQFAVKLVLQVLERLILVENLHVAFSVYRALMEKSLIIPMIKDTQPGKIYFHTIHQIRSTLIPVMDSKWTVKDGNQGKHRVTKRGPALSNPMFTLVTSEDIAESKGMNALNVHGTNGQTNKKNKCLPKRTEYLSYEETLGIILMSTSITSSLIPLCVLGLLIHYKATPIVKANNYTVSCLLLVSMSLCFLSSLAFIGYPNHLKCLLRQVTFGMAFALCVSCVLAKTVIVMIAFRATKPNSSLTKWARPQMSYLVIILGTFIELILSTTWLLMAPPFPQLNLNSNFGVIIAECNEGSLMAFWCTTGFLGVLALASFLLAFLTRHLPGNYNESRFITFSMLAFLSVWVSYIPASLSTSGKYTVAMEIFAILSSNWAMLCCMFAPKCYVILFKPNMNSRKYLLWKN
ncbi:unnamed protein product [Ranitomeya imitator]|uniref:G-protein coupled receptors family 3 profile domain-containing protein n=1 Tax=Ranitomeya imitator TaxID=111125 RepID=A0ABN9KPH9_9NEOB|nr:unnamed protein product [Ranitomeya imitator]